MARGEAFAPTGTGETRIRTVLRAVAVAAERAGRAPEQVRVLAVTKTLPPETVRAAYAAGLRLFGENRVQEAARKLAQLDLPGSQWELIGHLQTNKAALAVQLFSRVQSVDSLHLARTLAQRAESAGRVVPILLEVNVAGEASKSGFAAAEVLEAAREIARLPHLRPEGLMTVAPLVGGGAEAERVRPVFRRLRELRDRLRDAVPLAAGGAWAELSMGMSDDYAVAIAEGATLVRLGRALFGERPAP